MRGGDGQRSRPHSCLYITDMSDLDARLVERARGGDAEAFDGLVRRHIRAARAVAMAVVANPHDADDVCQDAFITALQRLEQCRDPGRFAGWLLQIVRNGALNRIRYEKSRPAWPLEAASAQAGGSLPSRDLERAELRRQLTDGLDTLTPVQREVVLLHDLEGWPHRDIAELLGVAEGTSRYHLSTARRALRKVLHPLITGEETT